MTVKTVTTSPNGMVLIWNYVDRIDANGGGDVNKTEARVIINSASLKSMSTNKSKASPAGSFEIRLAPTFNWVTRITVGSWCVLLMSPDQDIGTTVNFAPGFVDPKTFKMLGRINSVRAVINVDQVTGARQTEYVVQGEDWASVFNTKLYIDPIARNNNLETTPAVGHAARILFDNMITDWVKNGDPLPSSSQVVKDIIKLWGDPLSLISEAFGATSPELLITSQSQFKLPLGVALYMKFKSDKNIPAFNLASLIQVIDGILNSDDEYSGDIKEAFGFPDPRSLYGIHSFWQLLIDNCNSTLNELIADIRFVDDSPTMAVYKRIKPFITRPEFGSSNPDVSHLVSPFKYVKRVSIPLEEILSINAGTNWRDKINFIEIRPQPLLNQTNFEVQVKSDSQTKDLKAFERDGFKPLIEKVNYMPYTSGVPQPLEAVKWKDILREWYFNTHNMLNGAVTFIGRKEYIQVGDNIEIDSIVFGAPFSKAHKQKRDKGLTTNLLAQVESIAHQFTVGANGERSFFTTVQFSRGIIADQNGAPVDTTSGAAIDNDAENLINNDEKNIHNTFGTSTSSDPDIQKLKGS